MRLYAKNSQRLQRLGMMSVMMFGFGLAPGTLWADTNWLTEDVSKGVFSIGGRAMYFTPIDGDDNWHGGAQVRLYLGEMFAIEGSTDYRKNDYGDTTVRTFPVQASGLFYLLPGKRLSPFVLGGAGWYFTDVEGPGGFDETQHRFGLHAGGGLQFMLHRNWSIDGSYRFVWLERVQSKDENLLDKNFQDEGHMVTIGLNYHF